VVLANESTIELKEIYNIQRKLIECIDILQNQFYNNSNVHFEENFNRSLIVTPMTIYKPWKIRASDIDSEKEKESILLIKSDFEYCTKIEIMRFGSLQFTDCKLNFNTNFGLTLSWKCLFFISFKQYFY